MHDSSSEIGASNRHVHCAGALARRLHCSERNQIHGPVAKRKTGGDGMAPRLSCPARACAGAGSCGASSKREVRGLPQPGAITGSSLSLTMTAEYGARPTAKNHDHLPPHRIRPAGGPCATDRRRPAPCAGRREGRRLRPAPARGRLSRPVRHRLRPAAFDRQRRGDPRTAVRRLRSLPSRHGAQGAHRQAQAARPVGAQDQGDPRDRQGGGARAHRS